MLIGTKRWLSSTVAIEPYSALDEFGQSTYGTSVNHAASIAKKAVKTFAVDGAEVVSSTQVYLDGSASVSVNDKITLPDATTPRIINMETINDPGDGSAYMKVIYT